MGMKVRKAVKLEAVQAGLAGVVRKFQYAGSMEGTRKNSSGSAAPVTTVQEQ